MNEVIDFIAPYLSLIMLGILGIFVVVNMLIGMGRGAKRAGLHLVIFVGLLVVAFLVTPFIVNAVLGIEFQIAGKTPRQYVDYYSDEMVKFLQQQFGDYVVPFQDYIKEYALGIVIALLNVVIFFALYFLVKIVAWVIYAIVAHFAAPKRNSEGKKNPKYAGWGLVLGALQGVCLFVIFLVPLNGVLSVVNHAYTYQAMQTANSQVTTQSMGAGYYDDLDLDINFNFDMGDVDFIATGKKINDSLSLYYNVMNSTGLQFLSDKAFEYQLTVRVENAEDINLLHDVNSGLELMIDSKSFAQVLSKLKNVYANGEVDLTSLTAQDYAVLRQFINKAFDLEILQVADRLLADMNEIFSTPFNDNETKLNGTDIYEHSLYGMLVKASTTERNIAYTPVAGEPTPTNYAQYAKGLHAVVNYVADQKLNLLRNDLINIIDLVEALNSNDYSVNYAGATQPTTFAAALAENHDIKGYLDLASAKLQNNCGKYHAGDYFVNILGDRLKDFSLVKMIGLTDFENLVVYNKIMDDKFTDNDALKDMVDGLIPMFLGKNAFNHYDAVNGNVQGNWEKLSATMLDVAHVLSNYVTIIDDINRYKAEFSSENETTAQAKALLKYLSELVIKEEDYDASATGVPYSKDVKFQKVDELVNALYELTSGFTPIKDFIVRQLRNMQGNNGEISTYMQNLIDMFDQDGTDEEIIEAWENTVRSIVNVAHIINDSPLSNLMDAVQGSGNIETVDFLEVVQDMGKDEITDMLDSVMSVPEISNTVQDALTNIFSQVTEQVNDQSSPEAAQASKEALQEYFGEEVTEAQIETVQGQISAVQDVLDQLNADNFGDLDAADQQEIKDNLSDKLGDLWENVQELLGDRDLSEFTHMVP